jgi:trk system potassium uptake protein TrkH
MPEFFKKLLHQFNYWIYEWRDSAVRYINAFRIIVNILLFVLLAYVVGFYESMANVGIWAYILEWGVVSLVLLYFLRVAFAIQRWQFIKSGKAEAVISGLIVLIWLLDIALPADTVEHFGKALDLGYRKEGILLIVFAVSYLSIFIIDTSRAYASTIISRLSPSLALVASFLFLIFLGTFLLMMPRMTIEEGGVSFIDSLFMSSSATCVTGLTLFDVGKFFTLRGQLVILFLIQAGGLGILYFTSFFASVLGNSLRFQQQLIFKEQVDAPSLFDSENMLLSIFRITFLIETITAVMIFLTWDTRMDFVSTGQKVYYSIFHAISAFCNAGFTLLTDGLYHPSARHAYLLHLVIITSVILGGLGFGALNDLFSPARLRQRLQKPWIDWQPSTKIAVFTSAVLLLLGTLWFLALENNSALTGQGWLDKLVTSFFQSATTRTAGFNTVDIGSLTLPVLLVMIILMFIGASSGSVGGGIKTSTFFIIFASVWQLIKGRRGVYINKRFLANDLYFKAMAIFAFAIAYNIIAFVILAVIHPDIKAISLLFEQVSAFGTVGLSMGITTSLSGGAKFLIISSMFLGRVGILTFAYSISGKQQSRNFKYPVTRIMVG